MMGTFRAARPSVLQVLQQHPHLSRFFRSYTPVTPNALLIDPAKLVRYPERHRAALLEAVNMTGAAGTSRLRELGLSPDDLSEPLSIDKDWHAAHFLLARTRYEPAPPPGDAILGGAPIGEDLGYGPLRVKTPADVASTALALSRLDLESLRATADPTELAAAKIYPDIWDQPDVLDDVVQSIAQICEYYENAAAAGDGMLLAIT
jgi:hypothetical protein